MSIAKSSRISLFFFPIGIFYLVGAFYIGPNEEEIVRVVVWFICVIVKKRKTTSFHMVGWAPSLSWRTSTRWGGTRQHSPAKKEKDIRMLNISYSENSKSIFFPYQRLGTVDTGSNIASKEPKSRSDVCIILCHLDHLDFFTSIAICLTNNIKRLIPTWTSYVIEWQ